MKALHSVCLLTNATSMHRWVTKSALLACLTLVAAAGCSMLPPTTLSLPSIPLNKRTQLTNPMNVQVGDSEFLWNQIVDTVEDYFRIKSEQRAAL
ncbi:MAG: hypothetical protein MUF23_18055, partial [Pirellula sp.]|nr:hypothetical protein [Pirellula sp.]